MTSKYTILALLFLVPACGDDDAASPLRDLSATPLDFSMQGGTDSSVPDMTLVGPSGQIAQARGMADTTMTPDGGTIALPIADVFVTYVKPLIGTDSAGFFVQAEQAGPALFIAVDPATLSPAPQPGDNVAFTVTAVIKDAGGVREARSISDWVVSSSGNDITGLVQDLSAAADLASAVDNYESELSRVEGDVTSAPVSSGTGFIQAAIDTAGLPTGSTSLRIRLASTVRDTVDLTSGCHFVIANTPLWRFNKVAQPSAWAVGDITVTGCPAPKVVSAKALSATSVSVVFDRNIDPATATVDQFTLATGITATAVVSVTGPVVVLNTGAQTPGTTYTVTVGGAVKDLTGKLVDPAANSTTFKGFAAAASLIITEFNPNITGADQIEFKALTGGTISGFKVYFNFTVAHHTHLSDLPDVVVATNDLILLHLSPPPSPAPLATETTDNKSCKDPTCVDGAWDVAATTNTGLSFTRSLITLIAPDGTTVVDAVAYSAHTAGALNNEGTELQAAIDAGLWTTACSPAPCDSSAKFDAASIDVTTLPKTVAGVSAQRKSDIVHSGLTDWQVITQTWGH